MPAVLTSGLLLKALLECFSLRREGAEARLSRMHNMCRSYLAHLLCTRSILVLGQSNSRDSLRSAEIFGRRVLVHPKQA